MFSPASRARSAAADIFALVVYSFIVGMLIEVFISGMSFNQSLSSRLLSIPVNILIAWPYATGSFASHNAVVQKAWQKSWRI